MVGLMIATMFCVCLPASADPLPPATPDKPRIEGDITVIEEDGTYEITVKTSNPIHDSVVYLIDYNGDLVTDEKYSCDDPAAGITFTKFFTIADYEVRVKAESELGLQSDWSQPLVLGEEEKSRPAVTPLLHLLLGRLLQPFQMLRTLLGL